MSATITSQAGRDFAALVKPGITLLSVFTMLAGLARTRGHRLGGHDAGGHWDRSRGRRSECSQLLHRAGFRQIHGTDKQSSYPRDGWC